MQQIVIKTNPIKVKKSAGIDFNITVKKEKKVKVETGVSVQVPNFVKEGDTIRVDTRTGEYLTRV